MFLGRAQTKTGHFYHSESQNHTKIPLRKVIFWLSCPWYSWVFYGNNVMGEPPWKNVNELSRSSDVQLFNSKLQHKVKKFFLAAKTQLRTSSSLQKLLKPSKTLLLINAQTWQCWGENMAGSTWFFSQCVVCTLVCVCVCMHGSVLFLLTCKLTHIVSIIIPCGQTSSTKNGFLASGWDLKSN